MMKCRLYEHTITGGMLCSFIYFTTDPPKEQEKYQITNFPIFTYLNCEKSNLFLCILPRLWHSTKNLGKIEDLRTGKTGKEGFPL
jgi:hypothetical protein